MIWKYGFTANEAIAFMRIVRPGSVVGPQQHFMYLKQLEWNKWAAVDEIRRRERTTSALSNNAPIITPATPPAEVDAPVEEGTMHIDAQDRVATPEPPQTPPPTNIPPVTPSRHVAAAQAQARAITPPGQPRKTPMAKRVPIESDDEAAVPASIVNADAMDEEADALPALGTAPAAGSSGTATVKPPSKYKARGSGGRTKATAASERTTRITRSALAGPSAKKPPAPASPTKAAAPPPSPNKIPRIAPHAPTTTGAVTRAKAAAAAGPSSRRVPPTPSRLPTLVNKRHNTTNSVSTSAAAAKQALQEAANAIGKKKEQMDAWMERDKASVVVPRETKSGRPGLRPIRRRRSSFSAADVVA
jgi:cell division cycle 14